MSYKFFLLSLVTQSGKEVCNVVVTLSNGTDLWNDGVLVLLVYYTARQTQSSHDLDVTCLG